jgi:lipoate-protein ligase A
VTVRGHTDLAIDGIKFSGNAQRRKKHVLLFHGALLLNFDLGVISELLPMPSKEPDYRKNRSHRDFLTNLGCGPDAVKAALSLAWESTGPFAFAQHETIALRAREKYLNPLWNLKFP